MQIFPYMKDAEKHNYFLNLQIEDKSGFLDSHRIPLTIAKGLLTDYDVVRPFFRPQGGLKSKQRILQSSVPNAPAYYMETEPFFISSWGTTDFKARSTKKRMREVSILKKTSF